MAKPMTKSATIAHLSQKSGLAKKQVVELFEQLEALAIKEAKNVFVLPHFGRLVLANRKARMAAIRRRASRSRFPPSAW